MIFSVITNTPCVVLLNNNHKILQTYLDWLSDVDFVCLYEGDNEDDILSLMNNMRTRKYQSVHEIYQSRYIKLIEVLGK